MDNDYYICTGISIGFVERSQPAITVVEGSSLSLTLEAIAAFGATQTELQLLPAAEIDSINSEADLGSKTNTAFV